MITTLISSLTFRLTQPRSVLGGSTLFTPLVCDENGRFFEASFEACLVLFCKVQKVTTMNGYRIDYIFQAPANCPAPHAQIVKVGIGNAAGHNPVWTVDEVIQAMKKGAIFTR